MWSEGLSPFSEGFSKGEQQEQQGARMHYEEAAKLVRTAASLNGKDLEAAREYLAAAQVHATLALAAATMQQQAPVYHIKASTPAPEFERAVSGALASLSKKGRA